MRSMNWLSRLGKRKRAIAWEYQAQGLIWRLLPSPEGSFVGEERDAESKSVSFFCVDRESGKVRWNGVQLREKWWVSIEAVHPDVVLLHEYAAPDLPDHKKIYALEISSGSLRWTNDELKFLFTRDDRVYASRDLYDSRIFFELDIHTGAVIRQIDPASLNVLGEMGASRGMEEVEFPNVFGSSAGISDPVRRTIERATRSAKRIDLIEYIEKEGVLAIGYYDNVSEDPVGQSFHQRLVITGQDERGLLFEDDLSTSGSAPVPDTFFSMGKFLYYIKDKRVLRAINLSSPVNRNGND